MLLPLLLPAQTHSVPNDFSITLERVGCLGSCPDYKVTILANGAVHYDGRGYVEVEGQREKTIPVPKVESLLKTLRDEDFFHWPEKKDVCLDFPQVKIAVMLNGERKDVLEGCNSLGKVLALADEIDSVAGTKRWVGKVR